MTEFTANAPAAKTKHATYRPAVFVVDAAITNPTMATAKPIVMCHVRSWYRPDDHAKRSAVMQAKK